MDSYVDKDELRDDYFSMLEGRKKQRVICSFFGCDRSLSLQEQLCGTVCIHHVKKEKIDIMKVLKRK